MRVKTKIVHALPFLLSLRVIKIISTSAMKQSRVSDNRSLRITVVARPPAAPLKREWVEAQGREKSQLGKMTQLLEQLQPSSQSDDFPRASSFHKGLVPMGGQDLKKI